ncbi:MAG: hypothetical protein RL238_1167 [Actinomycetota bacterium]|jgi:GrpB-like predicted nucleotidyltransferase (UPF0157 family)
MTGALVVVPYDPEWPTQFDAIRTTVLPALAGIDVLAMEHVGSTSVPGLAAKPVIDVDVVVQPDDVAAASAALESIGYTALGEMGVPQRWAFRPPAGAVRQNLYVTVTGCLSLRNHLGLRDTLRADPELRDRYGAVKLALAERTDDIDVYIDGKTEMVLEILAHAGIDQDERAELERINRL